MFAALDAASADKLDHKAIVRVLSDQHGVPAFPEGVFTLSSKTKDKYIRGSWSTGARLDIGLYAKGKGKAQIAVQVSKLADATDVERERAAWKAALARLQARNAS